MDKSVLNVSTDTTNLKATNTGGGANVLNVEGESTSSHSTVDIKATAATGSKSTINVGTTQSNATDEINIGSNSSNVSIVGSSVTITGTTTSALTETVEIADNIIELNSNITSEPREDAGFEVNRGTTTATSGTNTGIGKPAILWDESEMDWTVKIVNTDDTDVNQSDVFSTNLGITLLDSATGNTPSSGATAVQINAMPIGGLFVNTTDNKVWIKTS